MTFGALAFLSPWLLGALATLPIIYWLLRAVPPSPARVEFPPTRILVGLENEEKTADKTPWWLTLIRLLAVIGLVFSAGTGAVAYLIAMAVIPEEQLPTAATVRS